MAEPSPPTSRLQADDIRAFWVNQATEHGQSPSASWSDHHAIELEIAAIGRWLKQESPGSRVLDAGCANGYSSARFITDADTDMHVVGIDYVEEMVGEATRRRATLPDHVAERLEFRVGDIRGLDFADAHFDAAICTRVIINLATREEQQTALLELARVVRPGGRLLISEATVEGWERLNRLRREFHLADIPMPSFNNYVVESEVISCLDPLAEHAATENFASTYFVGSRVLKPLLAAAAPGPVDGADPTMEINRWFGQIPPFGDYGTQKLFVFTRR
jgi:ubiquinone/menaquinone biosynthesis C-methylase UbiE